MARSTKEITIDPPYREALEGILSFKTFDDAEQTLQRLEALRQKYIAEGDDRGCEHCRKVALAGRRRAELISRDSRVQESKRRQKEEIAFWFQVWLENPDIFDDWLSLRKATDSYKRMSKSEISADSSRRKT